MEAARAAGVIVLLDGQGADEILGGYHKFLASVLLAADPGPRPPAIPVRVGRSRDTSAVLATVLDAGESLPGTAGPVAGPRASWLRVEPDTPETAPAIRARCCAMQLADIERWSLPNLLSYVDRSSMAFGVETRLPYLDPDVAALALAMPADVLTRGGWSKWPLRQALADRNGAAPAWRPGQALVRRTPASVASRTAGRSMVDQWRRDPHPMWAGSST